MVLVDISIAFILEVYLGLPMPNLGFSTGKVIQPVLAMNDKIEKKNNETVDLSIKLIMLGFE